MTAHSPWTPSIADAYANKYGEVAEDLLSLVVIPSLAALEQKFVEIAEQEDQVLAAFHLRDHRHLITKTSMALCLGIQSLREQQLRDYPCRCPRAGGVTWKVIKKASWGFSPKAPTLNKLFSEIRGLPIEGFESYRRLDKLQLLGSICRHGAGDSADKLQARYPELWPQAMVEAVPSGDSLLTSPPLDSMQITVDLLRDLVNPVVLFWLDMRIACTETLIQESRTMIEEVARLRALRPALF